MARSRASAFGKMPIGHALLAAIVLLGPAITFGWLAANPERDRLFIMPSEHFMVVTVVALLAVGVALLVIRVALRMEQYQVFRGPRRRYTRHLCLDPAGDQRGQ